MIGEPRFAESTACTITRTAIMRTTIIGIFATA
jgi:hypothetical protein